MDKFSILKELVIILLIAIPIVYLFKKLNISTIVGYLITGVLAGPFGLGLITGTEQIDVLAEIGLILLMFTIGLEFSYEKLVKMKSLFFSLGASQFIVSIIVFVLLFLPFSLSISNAVFLAMLVTLSSTTIILKLLADRGELDSPYGKLAVAISIFQDMALIPMMLLLPILGARESLSLIDIIIRLFVAGGLIAGILLGSKILVPKILYYLANMRIREIFTIGILLLILGTAFLTEMAGLSFSIGAFLAGMIISESDYSSEIIGEILPFKDAFNAVFFISIGLLLNISFVFSNPVMIILLVVGIVIIKAVIVALLVRLLKYSVRVSVLSGLIIAQIGEFSFILAQTGKSSNLISGEYYFAFIASTIFTMLLTPFLIEYIPKFFQSHSITDTSDIENGSKKLQGHVIIAGYGLNGKNLAFVLKNTGIPFIIIELNPNTINELKSENAPYLFGDITKRNILLEAGILTANCIVYAISDPLATKISLKFARQINPSVYAIVRTRYTTAVKELQELGASEVIPEEFETSLQIFSKVLTKYHIPLNIIMRQVSILRDRSYSMMLNSGDTSDKLIHLDELLAAGLTETYYVAETNPHIGKTLQEINIRALTGATVLAIVRTNKTITNPAAGDVILFRDTLVITGNHQSVDTAVSLLNGEDQNTA